MPVSSISIATLGGTARTSGTMGVVQNRPIFTPGVANRRLACRHGQVAGRHQLASGRRGEPLHAGDDRLGKLPNLLHDARTPRE